MTAAPVNVSASDRFASLNTAAAVQGLVTVSFAGGAGARLGRAGDASDIASLSTMFERLAAAKADGARFASFDKEVSRTTGAIAAALNTRIGNDPGFTFEGPTALGRDAVSNVTAKGLDLAPGEELGLDVLVTASAQQGALYLSLGVIGVPGQQGTLDLGNSGLQNSTFSIEIAGNAGSRVLSFSSGQTLGQIAAAINTFTGSTGVIAETVSSTGFGSVSPRGGIALRSAGFGEDDFVSVEVVDNASVVAADGTTSGLGVYRFDEDNANPFGVPFFDGTGEFGNGIDESSRVSFADAVTAVADAGRSVAGTINGVEAIGRGTELFAFDRDAGTLFRVDFETELFTPARDFGIWRFFGGSFPITLTGTEPPFGGDPLPGPAGGGGGGGNGDARPPRSSPIDFFG